MLVARPLKVCSGHSCHQRMWPATRMPYSDRPHSAAWHFGSSLQSPAPCPWLGQFLRPEPTKCHATKLDEALQLVDGRNAQDHLRAVAGTKGKAMTCQKGTLPAFDFRLCSARAYDEIPLEVHAASHMPVCVPERACSLTRRFPIWCRAVLPGLASILQIDRLELRAEVFGFFVGLLLGLLCSNGRVERHLCRFFRKPTAQQHGSAHAYAICTLRLVHGRHLPSVILG